MSNPDEDETVKPRRCSWSFPLAKGEQPGQQAPTRRKRWNIGQESRQGKSDEVPCGRRGL